MSADWRVLAAPEETMGNEEELVPYAINGILHEMIEEAKSKGKMDGKRKFHPSTG